MGLGFKKDETIGLDIGSDSVKMVRLKHRRGKSIAVSAAHAVIESPSDGQGDNSNAVVNAIHECFDQARVKRTSKLKTVCGISGPDVVQRSFHFPQMPENEIADAVMLEASQICPFNMDNSFIDYQLLPVIKDGNDKRIHGILVAATKEVVKQKRDIAKEAYINCTAMDVDGLALINCFNSLEKNQGDSRNAILNIGANLTTVAIAAGAKPPFIRDISSGGNDIFYAMASTAGLTKGEISEIINNQEEIPDNVQQCIDVSCKTLAKEINETLLFYTNSNSGGQIDRVLICGGLALSKKIIDVLISYLPQESQVWDPCTIINRAFRFPNNVFDQHGPSLAVAVGLAMRRI